MAKMVKQRLRTAITPLLPIQVNCTTVLVMDLCSHETPEGFEHYEGTQLTVCQV